MSANGVASPAMRAPQCQCTSRRPTQEEAALAATEVNTHNGEGKEMSDAPTSEQRRGFMFFNNRICPFGHRAWWALLEKGLDADAEYVHIKLGAAKPAWYKAEVAPTGTVPSVIHRGRVILESLTVVEYLDEVAPDRGVRLMPEGAADRAAVRAFAKRLGDSHTAPFYRALSMSPDDVRRGDPRVGALADCLASVEGMFAEQALVNESVGPYFLGARFSVADIAVAPFLDRFSATIPYFTGLPSLLTPAHPRLAACLSACRDRPAFKATAQTPAFYIASYKTYARGKVDAARKVAVKRSAAVAFH